MPPCSVVQSQKSLLERESCEPLSTVDVWYCRDSLQVDIAYVPFIERFQIFFSNIKNYDITKGRPNLQKFIEVIQTDGR
jgi:hypothetical protein